MKYNIYDTEEYDISDDLYFLRFFSEYNNWKTDKCNILYENKNTVGLNSIRSFFKLDPLIIKNNQLKTILNIKKYASDILHFAGEKIFDRKYDNLNCFDLLNLAKKEGKSLNCRYITSVFTQMLLSIGYKARWVSCHSMDIRDKECHCVCEVYIDSLKKWIVCDPSFNCLYFNKKGNILNLYEMRKLIIKGERLIIAADDYNKILFINNYWIKNIFRFSFIKENKFNMLASKNKVYFNLNPKGFIIEDKVFQNKEEKITMMYFYNYKCFWNDEV